MEEARYDAEKAKAFIVGKFVEQGDFMLFGEKVIDRTGPNAFNDEIGPFFKMGLYKGWGDPKKPCDAVDKRVVYHDEFRMGGADASYEDVAPGP